jgi:uncharacterized protein YcfJ
MKRLLVALMGALLFSSGILVTPASAQQDCKKGNTGQTVGTVVGGVLGGLLGRKIDGGRDRTIGTLIGGAAGALVGSEIGKALDKCEQQKVAETTTAALNGPANKESTQSWTSDTRENVSGTMTASPVKTMPDGRVCRMVTRVNYVDGEELHDSPMFCKTPPSTAWTPT